MAQHELKRGHYALSLASDFLDTEGLSKLTGQSHRRFADVIMKELVDNAIDACESAKAEPVVGIDVKFTSEDVTIRISDVGRGISAETLRSMLDFDSRTSDKSVYHSPTRGQQGNGLKTVLGIPYALGGRKPVVIESRGLRHEIRLYKTLVNSVECEYSEPSASPVTVGTSVTVCIPHYSWSAEKFLPDHWIRAFAIANPFVTFNCSIVSRFGDLRNFRIDALVDNDSFNRWLSTDPTSIHWYTEKSLRTLIGAKLSAGENPSLREFATEFDGFSNNRKTKPVTDALPHIECVRDFDNAHDMIPPFLRLMKEHARVPNPKRLGAIGGDHFRQRFAEWYGGVRRDWYHIARITHDDIPYVFEVIVAETEKNGDFYSAVNFSPTFDDPFGPTWLDTLDGYARGVSGVLEDMKCLPRTNYNTAVAVHLIGPVLAWTGYGKVNVSIPSQVIDEIQEVLKKAVKTLYKERKDRGKVSRSLPHVLDEHGQPAPRMSQKDAVFLVLEEAMAKASGGGQYPVSARTLYYQVRPLIQKYVSSDLEYNYFSQTLLTYYRNEIGEVKGLYYDPRGVLIEPHTGTEVPLGTREVEEYRIPDYVYNKLLYIEKKGLLPILKTARIAERYDMAIVAGEGYANEATRRLLEQAEKGREYQIFVIHDADPDGYNIVHALSEETKRMPDHNIQIFDIGLKIEDAVKLGIEPERFRRSKEIPAKVRANLSPLEETYFVGRSRGDGKSNECMRVEINALSAPQFVDLIERRLTEAGVSKKVIPSPGDLPDIAKEELRGEANKWARDVVAELIDMKSLETLVFDEMIKHLDLAQSRDWIVEEFEKDDALPWDTALTRRLREEIEERKDGLRETLTKALQDKFNE